ncbi:hypothetical protein GLA29479_4398 [Lysobacter antibioticus]|nr:hypothetical protein GLA29479_4398 [Lysobacter antibioticus]
MPGEQLLVPNGEPDRLLARVVGAVLIGAGRRSRSARVLLEEPGKRSLQRIGNGYEYRPDQRHKNDGP